jgi:hypothetical protein
MTNLHDQNGLEGSPAENGYLDLAIEAARARAMVWRLAQKAVQEKRSEAMTLAGLSAMVTRSAALTLGMDEDELAQLLRSHRPH